MKTSINTNIAPYDFVGRPKSTKNQKNKKLVLPEIKRKTNNRQGRDLVKQNGETKKQLRTTSMVLGEIPDKTYVSQWTFNILLREQQAKQDEEKFLRSRKNIQKTMAEYAILARQRNRSVEAPRRNLTNSQLVI